MAELLFLREEQTKKSQWLKTNRNQTEIYRCLCLVTPIFTFLGLLWSFVHHYLLSGEKSLHLVRLSTEEVCSSWKQWNVFVWILKCICIDFEIYIWLIQRNNCGFDLAIFYMPTILNLFDQIWQCTCPDFKMHLSEF